MGRKNSILFLLLSFTASGSAQVTSGGYSYDGTQSIPDLLNHLFGIQFHNPYEAIGFASTLGVLWVATYVIFKVGIKKIDDGLDNDGVGDSGIAEALGVESEDSRNVLAILTLLIVLTMMGTGGFLGVINGWRTLILLTFTISILAGLIFVLIGGASGIVGGARFARGAGKQVEARGIEEMADAEKRIADAEEKLLEAEKKAEKDAEEGDEDKADSEAEYDEEQLQDIIDALDDAMNDLETLTAEEIHDLAEAVENLEEIVELLEVD